MKNDIYTLAHEIKNPLCVASGYLEMMNEKNFERYKDIIQNQIDTSLEILNNYLEFKDISLNKEEIDFNLLLLDIKNSMKDYLKKKNVHLDIKTIDDEIYVDADYNKLKQVFYNIIKNGLEAHAKNIKISYQLLINELYITIVNDGDRISDEALNRVGNNYSNKVLGNGIGTTLAKKIIALHKGKMRYNNCDEGVKITISLPL